MNDYDSDSSAGDDAPYMETTTLLGYTSREPTDDAISHLGGVPTWIDKQTAPSGSLAKCRVCSDYMCLLLQLNGDMPTTFPGHERRLYVYSCRRRTCRGKEGSVRGIRGCKISRAKETQAAKPTQQPPPQEQKSKVDLGATLFGSSSPQAGQGLANPFASPSSSGQGNPFAAGGNPFSSASALAAKPPQNPEPVASLPETFASKVKISEDSTSKPSTPQSHEPWPTDDKLPPSYPHYHLDADYETIEEPSTPEISNNIKIEEGESSSGGGKIDKELFESTMDKTFQKFADRMAQNPEQVIRYEFGGQILLYNDKDTVGRLLSPPGSKGNQKVTTTGGANSSRIPRCTNCGSERTFEVQLTPHAITELEADEMTMEGMDWGTIIVGVCSKDCSPAGTTEGWVGYAEEWVGVQWEEVTSGR